MSATRHPQGIIELADALSRERDVRPPESTAATPQALVTDELVLAS